MKTIRNALICYLSYSGNTQEVAELIQKQLEENLIEVTMYDIGYSPIPEIESYDSVFIGTFTWDEGALPDEMQDFIDDLGDISTKNVYCFGSGETQFGGDDLFCRAADLIANKYNSPYRVLKIEQSPRGSQEIKVIEWVNEIIKTFK